MKTILVGTDFSAGSDGALNTASNLLASGGSVHLLHVLEPVDDPDSEDPETQTFYRELEQKSQQKLADQLSRSGLEARSSVRIGARHLTLMEVAEELDADLIVLGSRPMGPDSKLLSVSHKVALTSTRPVLLVPRSDD
ncbi:MAG: universal stress protein [Candidatus Eremiobacteraeota bacterium]|nr:universal stress protein [Candidatus Eremiobacteraeota bacterium]